jgi:hypothetical protein
MPSRFNVIRRRTPGAQYIGQLATRCVLAQGFYASAASSNWGNRQYHYARDDITQLQVAFGQGWYIDASTINVETDVNTTATVTMTASIEYPAGNFYQLKWGGSPTLTVAQGTTQFTDVLNVVIPKGAKFYTRQYLTSTAAGGFNVSLNNLGGSSYTCMDPANGDASVYLGGDQTMGGTMNDEQGGLIQMPILAIVGPTRQPSIGIIGDSRTALAVNCSASFNNGNTGGEAIAVGPYYGYINVGRVEDQANFWSLNPSGHVNRLLLLKYCSHLLCEIGINDIHVGGRSAAQLKADLTTIAGMVPSLAMFASTIPPETTSTDNWATTANQTPLATAQEAIREAVNIAIRAGLPGMAGYYDQCAFAEYNFLANGGGGSGLWNPGLTADGIHYNQTGYNGFGTSGLIDFNRFILNQAR